MADLTPNDNAGVTAPANNSSSFSNAKNNVANNISAASNTVQNHPLTQSVVNGPVAQNVKDQGVKTKAEFSNLAAARTTPATPAATGQQLTQYHSFFSSLLSWENPRASAIAFLATVTFVFATRYLDILRYAFKLTWMTLAVTVVAEVAGKTLFSSGFTSQIRPKKYYIIPKATLDSVVVDLLELINFFVIESQRIVFAENVFVSSAAFLGAFVSYYLIKIVPYWGLTLIATCVLFLAPLIYKTNKELIDHHVANASNVVNQQTEQVKQLANHHAARATETTKQYVGEYTAKAQEMIGNARGRSTSPIASTKAPLSKEAPLKTETQTGVPKANIPVTAYKDADFPAAPKDQFQSTPSGAIKNENEPLIST